MAKRLSIGLNFSFNNQTNSGIVNYLYNIVAGLNTLPDTVKPHIILLYSNGAPVNFIREINYPFIKYKYFSEEPRQQHLRKINSLFKNILKHDLFKYLKYFRFIDVTYPYFLFLKQGLQHAPHKIHWLVDFNLNAYPLHYAIEQAEKLEKAQNEIIYGENNLVVLSSESLFNELKFYYPDYTCKINILKFACTLPDISTIYQADLLTSYNIKDKYFMSPNQFWEHKNQSSIFEALKIIQQERPDLSFKVLFTGSLDVNRGKGFYAELLKKKLKEYKLEQYVKMLGVIDRKDQLALMKFSLAIIQPSLYEGWSTLVEEAKALNKHILVSNLPVHLEQISENATFFDPHNYREIAQAMINQLDFPAEEIKKDYLPNVKKFGANLLELFTKATYA